MKDWSHIYCSFCGQSQQDARAIVVTQDQTAAICSGCVEVCTKALEGLPSKPATANWPYGSMGEYIEWEGESA